MKEMLVASLKWLVNWPKNFIKRKFKLYYSILTNKEARETYKGQWTDKFSGLSNIYESYRVDMWTFWGTKFFVFLYVYFPSWLTVEEEDEDEVVLEEEEEAD